MIACRMNTNTASSGYESGRCKKETHSFSDNARANHMPRRRTPRQREHVSTAFTASSGMVWRAQHKTFCCLRQLTAQTMSIFLYPTSLLMCACLCVRAYLCVLMSNICCPFAHFNWRTTGWIFTFPINKVKWYIYIYIYATVQHNYLLKQYYNIKGSNMFQLTSSCLS
jgi:hypothetical protein